MSFLKSILQRIGDNSEALISEARAGHLIQYSGARIAEMIAKGQAAITAHGVRRAERVALLAPNSAQWVAADFAIIGTGAVSVPLYHRLPGPEIAEMLRQAAPRLVVVGDEHLRQVVESEWPEHCAVVLLATLFDGCDTALPCESMAQDIVTIVFTSGTSGKSKGVVTTIENVEFVLDRATLQLDRALGRLHTNDKLFHYLPLNFSASRTMLWVQLSRGRPLVLSTNLNDLPEELKLSGATHMLTVPMVLERIRRKVEEGVAARGNTAAWLYQRALKARLRPASGKPTIGDKVAAQMAARFLFTPVRSKLAPEMMLIISGSAPLSEDTQRWFELLGIPVVQAYGLTETAGLATMEDLHNPCTGSIGRPLDGMEYRVTEAGEFQLRGTNIFSGYWNDPAATSDAFEQGWFKTGDIVTEQAGLLKIIGRAKNLIVLQSGHNVAPEPIEEELMARCSAIEQCVVVGHARPYLAALHYGAADLTHVEAAIARYNESASHYRQIRAHHRLPEALTMENSMLTANQKIRRTRVETYFAHLIGKIYRDKHTTDSNHPFPKPSSQVAAG